VGHLGFPGEDSVKPEVVTFHHIRHIAVPCNERFIAFARYKINVVYGMYANGVRQVMCDNVLRMKSSVFVANWY